MNRYVIDDLKGYSLSNTDLEDEMGYNIPIIKYDELKKYNNIDELLYPNNEAIMLYETHPNVGHWVCIFKRNNNTISFFDSLGLKPDDQFHRICIKFRKNRGILLPYLTYLLSECPYNVEYNEYPLQNDNPEIATCGRWCIERLRNKKLTPCQFYNKFKPEYDIDSDDKLILKQNNFI